MAGRRKTGNIIGKAVRKRRIELELSQATLTARLQIAGLDISRVAYAQIECELRGVRDFELKTLAKVLGVSADGLLGTHPNKKQK